MTDETTGLRDKVIRRVQGLLAKTVENGATEAEAMSSAAKARELLDSYHLSLTDLEIRAEPIETEYTDRPAKLRILPVDNTVHGIMRYCGVKIWNHKPGNVRKMVIFGHRADIEMAKYLYQLIHAAIERETKTYQQSYEYTCDVDLCQHEDYRRSARIQLTVSFQLGMAHRISNRLTAMAKELEPTALTGSGTALVIVKNAAVQDAYDNLGIKWGRGPTGARARNGDAYNAGAARGDNVNLRRPLNPTSRLSIA